MLCLVFPGIESDIASPNRKVVTMTVSSQFNLTATAGQGSNYDMCIGTTEAAEAMVHHFCLGGDQQC